MARLITETLGEDYEIKQFKYQVGRRLEKGERSSNGLYALVSKQKHIALRIQMTYEHAMIYSDEDNRYLTEVYLEVE